jgi:TIR domain/AAA ATPase domain
MSDKKPIIFISYSQKDEPDKSSGGETWWLTYIQSHLQPAVKDDIFDLWTDYDIDGGDDWRAAIDKKLNDCDIFILLVSRHSVSSDFICGVEVDRMLARRRTGEIAIYPIVLSPFATSTVPWLMELNLMPSKGKPLSTFGSADRDLAMVEIVEEIAAKARKTLRMPAPLHARGADSAARFSENASAPTVDIAHLPETAYENLVGRELELKRLDQAWADPNTNILSLIAEGGAGKSALVNEWLKRLQADNYRGAEAVLGWSFYNQGTKERATAADEFINWALDKLGLKLATISASAKAEAIAEAMARRRMLLVLDGIEPLQHGLGTQAGQLKDQGLRALLRRLATVPPRETHGLIVLTSRLAVKDITHWKDSSAPIVDVEQLSNDAGAALLRDNGVWGTNKELEAAAHDFGGHPLALGLLASFLKETQTGDVRRRDHIRKFFADPENPRHDHAKRVMESYEKEWLAADPVLLAIMHMVGLFDRPATRRCLRALRNIPIINGLTDHIIDLDDKKWQRAIARLREARLLAPPTPSMPEMLDAHPLVREWFGEQLKIRDVDAWHGAHGRLYEHLRDTTHEGRSPNLEDLMPLYHAVRHGCHAERHREVLHAVLIDRIYRRGRDAKIEFYATRKLGSIGSDLAAISWYFDVPYEQPLSNLIGEERPFVLNVASFGLRAQGRLLEALAAEYSSLSESVKIAGWAGASESADNLSGAELTIGNVSIAVRMAEKAVRYADRAGNRHSMVCCRATYADALHAAGNTDKARILFDDAERMQEGPILYSVRGYQYGNLLLSQQQYASVEKRAQTILGWQLPSDSLVDRALIQLMLDRSKIGAALMSLRDQQFLAKNLSGIADSTKQAMEGLRVAGFHEYLARALVSHAGLCRNIGDWNGAARDLNEVEEIAEPGPMKLFLSSMALERTRLAFARIEAFAPLNGLTDDSPLKPLEPDTAEAARLKEEAAKQLAIAANYIKTCGYHGRDEELTELEAVLRGERKFADLPPRV